MTDTATHATTGAEVELKYSVSDPDALATWIGGESLREAGLALGPEQVTELDDRYVDTADGRLRAGGFAARLRTVDGQVTISLKGRVAEGDTDRGRHQRAEIEAPATDSPDPSAWPPSDARVLVQRLADAERLRERFRIHQHRREWRVTREHEAAGATDEAVLSLQAIEVYRAGQLLGEQDALEVELVRGDEAILREVATALGPTGLVEAETTSKEELAETLVRLSHADGSRPRDDDSFDPTPDPGKAATDGSAGGDPAAEKATAPAETEPPMVVPKAPGIRADDSLAEAGGKVLAMHLARMLAREAGTRAGDVEDLHKMRVATRRMRATWRTFEGAWPPKRAKRYVKELKVVADRLGAVRDLDVQLEGLSTYAAGSPVDADALAPLSDSYQRRRDAARDELLALLDSGAYRRFVDDYRAFVAVRDDADEPEPAAEPGIPTRVRDTAGGRVWVAYEHLRAYHETLAWADVPTLHQVRIAGKRLRYGLESFREVLGPDVDGVIARVTALQDHLGELNDADLAAHLTREFLVREAGRLPAASTAALGRYLASREREVQARRRSLPAVWRQVVGLPFRRALGRSLSSL